MNCCPLEGLLIRYSLTMKSFSLDKDKASLWVLVRRAEESLRKLAAAKENPVEPEKPKVVPKTKRGLKRKRSEEEDAKEPVELTKERMADIEEEFAHFIATSTISLTCVENPRMEKWLKKVHPDVSWKLDFY